MLAFSCPYHCFLGEHTQGIISESNSWKTGPASYVNGRLAILCVCVCVWNCSVSVSTCRCGSANFSTSNSWFFFPALPLGEPLGGRGRWKCKLTRHRALCWCCIPLILEKEKEKEKEIKREREREKERERKSERLRWRLITCRHTPIHCRRLRGNLINIITNELKGVESERLFSQGARISGVTGVETSEASLAGSVSTSWCEGATCVNKAICHLWNSQGICTF